MILELDDILQANEELGDTLAAARIALETLAASHLPFAAQVRIHRASTRRARAWVLANVDLSPFPAVPLEASRVEPVDEGGLTLRAAPLSGWIEEGDEPRTEEVDRESGDDLDDLADIEEVDGRDGGGLVQFDDDGDDPLVSFEDREPLEDDQDPLDDAETMGDQELEALISYEGDFDVDVDADLGMGDEESGGDEPSPADVSSLVIFEEETPVLTLGGGRHKATPAPLARSSRPTVDDEDSGIHDGTLVTNLDDLVKLEDLLSEEVASDTARRQSTPRPPERQVGPSSSAEPKVRVAATLTDEDLGLLGFNSQREIVSPEGSDADPASETGSRKAIPVPRGPARRDDARAVEPIAPTAAKVRVAATPTSTATATPGPARVLTPCPPSATSRIGQQRRAPEPRFVWNRVEPPRFSRPRTTCWRWTGRTTKR